MKKEEEINNSLINGAYNGDNNDVINCDLKNNDDDNELKIISNNKFK